MVAVFWAAPSVSLGNVGCTNREGWQDCSVPATETSLFLIRHAESVAQVENRVHVAR